MSKNIDLSIIIVSWNTKDLLDKCLRSVYENNSQLNLEVFVVDNNSKDQTVDMVKSKYPLVKLISNNKNLGFAVANNQALKKAQGKYILLLNPDTEILEKALERAIEFMANHLDCGVMGAKLLNTDKTVQFSVRKLPTWWPIFLLLVKAPKFFKKLKALDDYLCLNFNYNKLQTVEQVMGAFMLMTKKLIDEIGLLDERFFIWFEEVDLCRRALDSGYQVVYNPDIEVLHHGGQSFAQEQIIKKQFIFFKSAIQYFLKHGFLNK